VTAKITTFLMFEGRAGEALEFYTSLFAGGAVLSVTRYGPGEPGAPGELATGPPVARWQLPFWPRQSGSPAIRRPSTLAAQRR
jgi:hypothetical protein